MAEQLNGFQEEEPLLHQSCFINHPVRVRGKRLPKEGQVQIMAQQDGRRPPVFVSRFGSVKASVWENETRNGPMFNVTLTRSFKDGEQWKDSNSFGYEDLLVLRKAVDACHTFIHEQSLREATSSRVVASPESTKGRQRR